MSLLISNFRNHSLLIYSIKEKERHSCGSHWVSSGSITVVLDLEKHEAGATDGQFMGSMGAQGVFYLFNIFNIKMNFEANVKASRKHINIYSSAFSLKNWIILQYCILIPHYY